MATSGENDDDALILARELLGISLFGLEEDGEEIPVLTSLKDVDTKENERAVLVDVYIPDLSLLDNLSFHLALFSCKK